MYESQPFSRPIVVDPNAMPVTDSTLASYWTGRQIASLERLSQTNDVISQIVDYSLDQRVLSLYTAFLALEPERGGEVCNTCEDESGGEATDVEDDTPAAALTTIEAYPNPFSTQVTLQASFAEPVDAASITVRIYDAMGQVVRTLTVDASGFVRMLQWIWDGTNDAGQPVASGTYFAVMTTPAGSHTLTLTRVG